MSKYFVEQFQVCQCFLPNNMATAASTGDWLSIRDASRAIFIFSKAVGAAGEDPTLTFSQATSAAGADTKAITFTRIDKKQAATDLTATGTFTKVTQSAANTFTHADLAEQAAVIVIEIRKEDVDTANGFYFLQCSINDVGSTLQVGDCLCIMDMSYPQETLPSVLA